MEGPARRLPADLAKPAPAVLPRAQRSAFTIPGKFAEMTAEQERAARQARAEAVVASVPADLLDALKSKADGLPGMERAGAYTIIRLLEKHHRAVERGDFKPEGK